MADRAGVAVVAGPTVIVGRADGLQELDDRCDRPVPALTDVALILACAGDDSSLISIPFAGEPVAVEATTERIVASGDAWILTCLADGPCSILDAVTLAPLPLPAPIPGGGAVRLDSGIGEFLVVGRESDRALFSVGGVVKQVRSGPDDDTWGELVRLADGRVAMEVQIDTGGIDGRPEVIRYVDPVSGEPLDYDDGADHNQFFDIGVDSVRVLPDVTLQRERVRAFTPTGTELWVWPDDLAVTATAAGRVWLATPGRDTIVEIAPRTGEVIAELVLAGPVADATLLAHADGWLVTRVEGEVGEQVLLLAV